jgi:hypothetical protein
MAGEAAAKHIGHTTGYLARDLSLHIPRIRAQLAG